MAKVREVCVLSEKDFNKQGKRIKKMAKEHDLIAITNRLSLFIDKTCRRWWFARKDSGVLISVEYGLVDREAINFLNNDIS